MYRHQTLIGPSLGFHIQSTAALIYQMAGRLTEASRAFGRADRSAVEPGRDRTESAGTLYNNWALMLGIAGQPLAAESLLRRAMDIERPDSSLATVSPLLLANYAVAGGFPITEQCRVWRRLSDSLIAGPARGPDSFREEVGMQTPGHAETIRIQLTEEQRARLRRAIGRDGEEIELRVEELEERIAPRLASNHNETLLIDG